MDNAVAFIIALVGLVTVVAIFVLVAALPTMWLWNWLMPVLLHLPTITFWQALGINCLTSILFKTNVTTAKGK